MHAELATVVIVGASLAGVAAAEELRECGHEGEIVVVGDERHPPYDRPPLSKQMLLAGSRIADCHLRSAAWADELQIDIRPATAAVRLDTRSRQVILSDGSAVGYDGAVIATGARPRMIPGADASGLRTLRTADDAIALRDRLSAGTRLAVVGGGFIGAEVAATARGRGVEVLVIEALPRPLSRVMPPLIGDVCARLHEEHGVGLRCGAPVAAVRGSDEAGFEIELADGSVEAADLVVLGLGVIPNTEWLAGSGIAVDDGVVCDAHCRTSVPGVVAAGDVARWSHPRYGSVRVEHWENAVAQGAAAVRSLLFGDDTAPFDPVPYVWSDQYACKIQVVGRPSADDEIVVVEGDPSAFRFAALCAREGRLTAGIAFNRRSTIRRIRQLLADDTSLATASELLNRLETAA
jgi:NADPH-dependent 2,4-dienoyl-CoA reductase/sulfur reductase-like enzyme